MKDQVEARLRSRWQSRATLTALATLVVVAVVLKGLEIHRDAQVDLLGLQPLDAPAPAFELLDRAGTAVRVEELRGKWVLLNFWATWCEPCRAEMHSMAALAKALAGADFVMIAASVDEGWAPVERFLGQQEPGFRVLLDPEAKWAHAFGTEKFPETYLIDPDGRLVARFVGPRNWEAPAFRRFFEEARERSPTR